MLLYYRGTPKYWSSKSSFSRQFGGEFRRFGRNSDPAPNDLPESVGVAFSEHGLEGPYIKLTTQPILAVKIFLNISNKNFALMYNIDI